MDLSYLCVLQMFPGQLLVTIHVQHSSCSRNIAYPRPVSVYKLARHASKAIFHTDVFFLAIPGFNLSLLHTGI